MEEKKLPLFWKISVIYFIWLVLYLCGLIVSKGLMIEYRMWVQILGTLSLWLGLPLWLFLLWVGWHRKKGGSRLLRRILIVIFCIVYLLFGYLFFLRLVFQTREEKRLFDDYLSVNVGQPLGEASYRIYRTRALVFREPAVWNADFEVRYLTQKYGQRFTEQPDLPVTVSIDHRGMKDDYIEKLTGWYVTNGCRELGIDRLAQRGLPGEDYVLYFYGKDDIEAAAKDLQQLIRYIMQDKIFQSFGSRIRLSMADDAEDAIYISFGKREKWDAQAEGVYEDTTLLEAAIRSQYESILENREKHKIREEERRKEMEQRESEESSADDAPKEDVFQEKARMIYEQILAPADIAERFETSYSAKGVPYYYLGEDDSYQYLLVYDRESKNGSFYLYVLYRLPYDADNGYYISYQDEEAQIMDIYAVGKDTDQIIASGKKTWGAPGTEEYRAATGE